ncbi:uncharacterized protein G2W53_022589 [Senna tora]|uniref:Uncharacterized protein n=1 Tax=Senna tora TaxID=362788 RepID=A0A834TM95_9FABA|nr:uncharacterized protein G2W53_022589 [Senna tora]
MGQFSTYMPDPIVRNEAKIVEGQKAHVRQEGSVATK